MQTIKQYDTKMLGRQEQIDAINAEQEVAQKKYLKLKAHFQRVDMNNEEKVRMRCAVCQNSIHSFFSHLLVYVHFYFL